MPLICYQSRKFDPASLRTIHTANEILESYAVQGYDLTLPEIVPVYELGEDMHTHIDPIEELETMIGKDRIIVVDAGQ